MASPTLQAVCLIERDSNNDVLWVWSYPGVDGGLRDLLMKKCNLDQEDQEEEEGKEKEVLQFSFGHYSQVWYYLANFRADQCKTLPKVVSFCIVILSKEFNPEKYQHLADIFGEAYISSGTPVSIVSNYLSAFTKGQITDVQEPCEPFAMKNYDIRKAYVACSFKDLVQEFGVESILIYNALLLKRRVAVYASSVETLLKVCRTLPLFIWHRQNWNIVFPWLELEEKELSDLSSHSTYVAGFTDPAIEGRTDLYDLFVNVPAATLSIAPHAKEAFAMTKQHKDIAMKLMESVQNEELSDQGTIKELSVKTKELISNLKTLIPDGEKLSLDMLHARKLTPATENFLYSLASVEGLTQL